MHYLLDLQDHGGIYECFFSGCVFVQCVYVHGHVFTDEGILMCFLYVYIMHFMYLFIILYIYKYPLIQKAALIDTHSLYDIQ